jgi:hypothetical protein
MASKATKASAATAQKVSVQKAPRLVSKAAKAPAPKPAVGGVAMVTPARGGVASSAAARADRSVKTKRQERQKAASGLLGEALQPEALEASERLPVPSLQGLFAISTEQGLFVGLAAPPNTQPLVRVGLAQRLPREWILPFDESRAALGLETMTLSQDLKAMVYLAFIPLVALGAADILKGQQLVGGQTIAGQLVTFSVTCEYYRQAKPQALAAKLLKLEALFVQVFEKTLAADHPLRKGFENLREQKTKAEQSRMQSSSWQGQQNADTASASLSATRTFLSQMPSDMQALKDRFLAEPQNEELAQAFGKKLLEATRQETFGRPNEHGDSKSDELEQFLTELTLLEFALVEREKALNAPKPAKTRQRKAAVALRALP